MNGKRLKRNVVGVGWETYSVWVLSPAALGADS